MLLDPLWLAAAARSRRPGATPAEEEAAVLAAEGGVLTWDELQYERYRGLDPSREHELQVGGACRQGGRQ